MFVQLPCYRNTSRGLAICGRVFGKITINYGRNYALIMVIIIIIVIPMVSLCFDNEKIKTLNFWLDSKGVEIHLLKKF